MLKVFICEDNKEQLMNYKKIVSNVLLIENFDMELALATSSPNELIEYISGGTISGIYFLDIDLHSDINGIELAEKIRKIDPRGFIIFVTTHAEMSFLTFVYKVEAMDFIIKDNYKNIKERIHECIKNAHEKYSHKAGINKVFSIKSDDMIINIDYNNILFFETSPSIHKVIVHCVDRQIEFYGKMKELEDKLKDDNFYRCHTSFIVNKAKIEKIDKKNREVHMVSGEVCLISTRGLKGLLSGV
ncbi:response regulator transcription factor [Clostridium sp. YIM B02505]|uniref:Stage 0 sporulation protein A homolog n=1 Tax=Clostridium yunnanense TaxID=2800325 RepID=A0ABS1ERN8_9CLOT|nr:LytTR family DNA-binding domain-containing protein [Clostridium yunnanense]MBK1811985.1 response regulator transcription factor [Clostridium yunnanense]